MDANRTGFRLELRWFHDYFVDTNYPDIYKVAVAGGPVIDWKWYEVMPGNVTWIPCRRTQAIC
ncbi:MAG: hypothetical protein ACLU4N_05510 [Butyricimonas faecihominis]